MVACFVRLNIATLCGTVALICSGAVTAHGARYTLKTSLSLTEEYNDNIFETRADRKEDLITHLTPGISFNYTAPLWDWNISYAPEYRHYLRGTIGDQFLQNLAADGNIRLIDNFLYLSVADSYKQAPLDGYRDSTYLNQSDQNIFRVSPYIHYRLDPRWTTMTGYRYLNRHYSYSGSISNQEHGVFLRATRELSARASVFMDVDFARVYTSSNTEHERLIHTVGGQYQYAGGSSLSAQVGYALFFPQSGSSQLSPYWNVGLIHAFDAYTFSLNSGVSFDAEPGLNAAERRYVNSRLAKEYQRGVLGISATYSETINSNTSGKSKWFTAATDATYALSRLATARASVVTDKYFNSNADQYRNSFTAGIRYELYYDLFTGLDYNRIAYADTILSPTGPIEVNRIMVYLTKTF